MHIYIYTLKYIILQIYYHVSPTAQMLSYNVILFNLISIIVAYYNFLSFFLAQQPPPPNWGMVSSFLRFLDYTQRRTTVGKTPLEE